VCVNVCARVYVCDFVDVFNGIPRVPARCVCVRERVCVCVCECVGVCKIKQLACLGMLKELGKKKLEK